MNSKNGSLMTAVALLFIDFTIANLVNQSNLMVAETSSLLTYISGDFI